MMAGTILIDYVSIRLLELVSHATTLNQKEIGSEDHMHVYSELFHHPKTGCDQSDLRF